VDTFQIKGISVILFQKMLIWPLIF